MFAWQDPDGDPTTKAAYKFPHHEVDGDGTPGAANLRGCSAGIAVLNGGRGGADIPDGDRQGVWSHLAAHLRDGDQEPPELKEGTRDKARPAAGLQGTRTEGEEERRVWIGELEVRESADGEPVIAGYAAVFNQWSEVMWGFREKISPGFFAPVLGDDVRALWQHDPNYVLGRTTTGTLRLAEDSVGLRVEIEPPDTQWARDALVTMRRGDVSQMSFGFQAAEDHWDSNMEPAERTLVKAARLFDVSPVTFPAYPQTTVSVRQHAADLRAQADAGAAPETGAGAGEDRTQEEQTRAREALMLRLKVRQHTEV